MSQYHKLSTPEDSAVVFIDHQPQMTFGVASGDRASLINNVTLDPSHPSPTGFGVGPGELINKKGATATVEHSF
jgi:hypothetical protein